MCWGLLLGGLSIQLLALVMAPLSLTLLQSLYVPALPLFLHFPLCRLALSWSPATPSTSATCSCLCMTCQSRTLWHSFLQPSSSSMLA